MKKLAPVLCCAVAIVALTAAGFLLYDSRDQLTDGQSQQESSFDSFSAQSSFEDPAPVIDDEAQPPSAPEEEQVADKEVFDWDAVDWDKLADEWEILEPTEDLDFDDVYGDDDHSDNADIVLAEERTASHREPAGSRQARQRMARIVVVTNFTEATVTVNGDRYPAYSDDGQNRGIEVAPNEVHEVFVQYGENSRGYQIELRPGEERLLMVELTGMRSGQASERPPPRPRRERRPRREESNDDDEEDEEGRITVYARPPGDIFISGEEMNERTPGTIDIEPGRHEVRVRYEDGEMSETKTVRVRQGSRVKLFFRQDDD